MGTPGWNGRGAALMRHGLSRRRHPTATTSGGHYAIEEVIRAQFGGSLRAFGGLRRRRNELEYPLYPSEEATVGEAAEALNTADEIIDAVALLLPNLGFF